ncbi:VOC family protein [Nocardia cyriacigeorgica]|uniref:VOC family protein n=1 Tax=Nocardia cyriacigeorgica TaxID=135487 RepID=UPI0035194B78
MPSTEDWPAPTSGLLVTHFLTVRDVAVSRQFYADIFGGEVVLEENPGIVKVANSWIIMNPGGGPTPDKPDVTLTPPEPGDPVSAFLNVRVADIAGFHAAASAKGASLLPARPGRVPHRGRPSYRDAARDLRGSARVERLSPRPAPEHSRPGTVELWVQRSE